MGSVRTVVPSRPGNQRTSSHQEEEEGGGGWLWTVTSIASTAAATVSSYGPDPGSTNHRAPSLLTGVDYYDWGA